MPNSPRKPWASWTFWACAAYRACVCSLAFTVAQPATAESTPSLPTVNVTAAAPVVQTTIAKKVYDVASDLQRSTGNAADVLSAVPSVEVDADGNVSLRGDSNVTILIDGRRSAQLSGSRAGDGLLQLSASDIEKIEVMTNPPAQYRAEGTAGVINIVTRKNKPLGTAASAQVSVGNRQRAVLGAGGSYSTADLSLNGSVGLRQDDRQRWVDSSLSSVDAASGQTQVAQETVNLHMRRLLPSVKVGLDYRPSTDQALSLDASLRERSGLRYFDQHNSTQWQGGAVTQASDRHSDGHEWSLSGEQSLGYKRNLSAPGSTLDVTLHRSTDVERERYAYLNLHKLPAAAPSRDNLYLTHDLRDTALGVDYSQALGGEQSLKLGLSWERHRYAFGNSGDTVDSASGLLLTNPVLTNEFNYTQQVQAAYGSYQATLGAWAMLAGLRAEHTQSSGNQISTGQLDRTSFRGWYPSLHLETGVAETGTVALAYSRRLSRPDPEALNPFVDYQDTHNLRAGNAHLLPQDTQSLELGYRGELGRQNLGTTLYARRTRNSLTDVVQALSPDVVLSTKANLPHSRSAGMEFNADGLLSPLLSYKLGGNAFYTQIDATALGATGLKSSTGLNLKASLDYHPTAVDTAQVSLSRADKRLTPQGMVQAINQVNLGYRHKVDSQLAWVATLSDVFNGQRFVRNTHTPTLDQSYLRYQAGQVFYLGLSYTLGAPKKGKTAAFEYEQ